MGTHAGFHDAGHGFDVFGLHPPSLDRLVAVAGPLCDRYFRSVSSGAEHVPAEGPAIVVANHGGVLPVDAALLCLDLVRRTQPTRIPRAIADHFVPRLPLVSSLFSRVGVVSGTRANVRHLLADGELIVIFPEGVSGPAKSFHDRYKLQRWRVGFAELAIRYQAPVVPAAIVGAEESWPLAVRIPVHAFGSPYLPIPAAPLPLPTRFRFRYGPAIQLGRGRPEDADDPELVHVAAEDAKHALERLLADTLAERRTVFG